MIFCTELSFTKTAVMNYVLFFSYLYWVSKLGPLIVDNQCWVWQFWGRICILVYAISEGVLFLSLMNEEERHSRVVENGLIDFEDWFLVYCVKWAPVIFCLIIFGIHEPVMHVTSSFLLFTTCYIIFLMYSGFIMIKWQIKMIDISLDTTSILV